MASKSEKDLIFMPNGGAPEQAGGEEFLPSLDEMTPREIVAELDKYIVGQAAAKRAVAVALRNRVRRQKLPAEIAEEILPKNILMIGPTGVGKTEIARRLARLAGCPFVKVEASKYTEVGYVGRDVESMVRDLVETSIDMVREEKLDEVADRAEQAAEERVLDLLLPPPPPPAAGTPESEAAAQRDQAQRSREKFRVQLREGKLDERVVDIEVRERQMPSFEIISNQGVEEMDVNLKDMLSGMIRTDHILFIAAGAFHVTKPSDLIPELQGRLPIRVELQSLKEEDFVRILTEPKNALIKQYVALLETEGIKLNITEDAVEAVAKFATSVNEQTENIGARRLHTILEKLLDEISFEAPDLKKKTVKVDAAYVSKQLADIVKNQDLSRYIL